MTQLGSGEGHEVDLGIDGLGRGVAIGSGSSGIVYRADELELGRTVAVKVFHSGSAGERSGAAERRMAGPFAGHTGVVPLLRSGVTAAGQQFLVMPFYGRGSLTDLVREGGPLGWREAVFLVFPIAETLADLHAAGIVHRDVKPGNVVLSDHLRPHLADFGISASISATEAPSIAYTPSFGAPETFDEVVLHPTVDVYSLAATLWALLAGHGPFVDDTTASVDAVVERARGGAVGRPSATVPDEIQRLLERSLSRDPAERPSHAGDFVTQLRQAVRLAERSDEDRVEKMAVQDGATRSTTPREVRDWAFVGLSLLVVLGLVVIISALVL